jgi:hypothetical protein
MLVKVSFFAPEAIEKMWAKKVAENEYVLDGIPVFAYGINLGDTFTVVEDPEDESLVFDKVLTRNGNATYRVSIDADPLESANELLDMLRRDSLGENQCDDRFRAFCISPQIDKARFEAILKMGHLRGLWSWENAEKEPEIEEEVFGL